MLHIATPLIRSTALSARAGRDVWLKMECAQPAGSFKQRGMGEVVSRARSSGEARLVSSSGGNAGLAVAVCARMVGMHAVIVVPGRTPALMRERIAAEGAEVVVHGEVWDDAHAHAVELAAEGGRLVHPFDDPAVWAGNSTVIDEAQDQMPKPSAVVLSVGGGGLMLGVLEGMRRAGWGDVPVVAMETEGAASLGAAVRAKKLVTLPGIDSIALTLGAKTVAAEALRQALAWPVQCASVSDSTAMDEVEFFARSHRVLVEPACGAALAGVSSAPGGGPVLVIVCGGAAATPEALVSWRLACGDSPGSR